jgi:uncharacterized protein
MPTSDGAIRKQNQRTPAHPLRPGRLRIIPERHFAPRSWLDRLTRTHPGADPMTALLRCLRDRSLRTLIASALALLIASGAVVASDRPPDVLADEFDPALAAELGADAYGMRRYVMALLKAGPNRDHDADTAAELQRGHMQNIARLASEGKLLLAGPFLHGGELRGVFVFDVEDIEEARRLTASDPAIQAGRLEMELLPWYGSAALRQLNAIHARISRESP